MKTSSLLTLVAATGLFMGSSAYAPANAADLGGGCCADLEERVAELEATTARKGNRVVSLQVYGFVSRGILFYDVEQGTDGGGDLAASTDHSEAVLVDEDGSRFGLRGSATLKPGWSAGYRIELSTAGIQGDDLAIRQNNMWIESEQLGRFTIGEQSSASDGIAHIVLANSYQDSGNYFNDIYSDRSGGSYTDFDGGRGDFIRYDSPSIRGFILSAGWSNDPSSVTDETIDSDEYWDVTLRYSGEFNAVRVAAGIGYIESNNGDTETFHGSGSIMHIPTGLYLAVSAGDRDFLTATDEDYWYLQGGFERSLISYGKTTIYGEYGEYDDGDSDELWGFGVVQSFDAAAMDLYAQYRSVEEDDGDDSFDTFILGGRINF